MVAWGMPTISDSAQSAQASASAALTRVMPAAPRAVAAMREDVILTTDDATLSASPFILGRAYTHEIPNSNGTRSAYSWFQSGDEEFNATALASPPNFSILQYNNPGGWAGLFCGCCRALLCLDGACMYRRSENACRHLALQGLSDGA